MTYYSKNSIHTNWCHEFQIQNVRWKRSEQNFINKTIVLTTPSPVCESWKFDKLSTLICFLEVEFLFVLNCIFWILPVSLHQSFFFWNLWKIEKKLRQGLTLWKLTRFVSLIFRIPNFKFRRIECSPIRIGFYLSSHLFHALKISSQNVWYFYKTSKLHEYNTSQFVFL